MTHHKYNSNNNLKFNQQSGRIFRHSASKKTARNNLKTNKANSRQSKAIGFLNVIFVFAGIFSVISFGLIFSPSFASAKVASAQTQKSQQVRIITNFNSQESNTTNKAKSFLQPIQIVEEIKK